MKTHTLTQIHTYTHKYTHIYTHTHAHTYTHTHTHIRTYTHTHIQTRKCCAHNFLRKLGTKKEYSGKQWPLTFLRAGPKSNHFVVY